MNGNDTFLDINNAHLRVNSGNVQASTFVLDQINIVTSANTASTVNFNNVTKAFNAASNIEVGTANLFVDTTTSNVGIGTDAPAYTLDVHGTANVEILQTTSNIVMNGGTFSLGGHMIPTAHEQYDIGTAEKKIRHLFLSDNSLWLGDETNITFSGGKMKFRRRKKNILPRGLVNIGVAAGHANETTTLNAALAYANKPIADMKLEHWLGYAKTLDPTKDISDVFTEDATGYEATSASEAFKEIDDEIYSTHKLRLGSSVAPTATLDITGTAKVSGDVTVDTNTFHIDTTNNRVGIGESSPAELVHIRGSKPQLLIEGESNENANIDFSSGPAYRNRRHQIQTEHYALSGHATSNKMHFRVNGGGENTPSIRMTVRGDGNVGIGTDAPGEKLEVHGHVKAGGNSYQNGYVVLGNNGNLYRNYGGSGSGLHMTGGAVIPADQNGGNYTSAHTKLGASQYKWGEIWSTSSTISSSDRNEKQDINEITESERKVASKIVDLFRTFRMKDAVSKKGDEARLHNGVIAQDLIEVFQSEGLDARRYGLFCYDDIWLVDGENELYETVYEKDDSEDGGLKEVKVKTGIFADKDTPGAVATPGPYSIRYEELLCFVVAGELQNERIKYSALEARITALENV
jgi:hypothetical protein